MNETEHLEKISDFYKNIDPMDQMLIDREVEIIKSYYSKNLSVLEVGCGSGYSTEKLSDIFDDYEVIEPSKNNIKLLTQRISKDIKIHNCLLEDFHVTKKYDIIFFLCIIEHVVDPINCLTMLIPFLKDGGIIFISCPNCMSLNRRIGLKTGMISSYQDLAAKDKTVGHRRLYTVEMLKDHCDKAGLRVTSMKGIYLKPMSEKQMYELGEEVLKVLHVIGEEIPEYCATLFATATKKYY